MLRLAIYYESRLGRNDGNPLYVWRELKTRQEQGLLEVDHLAPNGDYKQFGIYDAHLWIDWGEDALKGILPYEPDFPPGNPLIYWASDTHIGYDYRLECAKKSDVVFVAQKEAISQFKRDGVTAPIHWLPHSVSTEAYPRYMLASKKYDLCFVGHVNSGNRTDALDRMFREFPNFYYGQRRFEDASRKYAESKVVFNISIKEDVNMRCFEVMGSGNFLLTNRLADFDDLGIKDGVHCVMYDSLDDAVEKARHYIDNPDERDKICGSAFELIQNNHTFKHRVDKILEEVPCGECIK